MQLQKRAAAAAAAVCQAARQLAPYAPDWLTAAVLIAISFSVPLVALPPRDRFATPGDPALSYPYHRDTVPGWLLAVLTVVAPLGVFAACAALTHGPRWVLAPT